MLALLRRRAGNRYRLGSPVLAARSARKSMAPSIRATRSPSERRSARIARCPEMMSVARPMPRVAPTAMMAMTSELTLVTLA